MTGGSHFDVDAILGDEPDGDPDDRAQLAARLSALLQTGGNPPSITVAQLAAYLDDGMTDEEKLSLYKEFSASAAARADLESAINLLDTVENAPHRPSFELLSRARDILAKEMSAPVPQKSIWRWLWEPGVLHHPSAEVVAGAGAPVPPVPPVTHKSIWRRLWEPRGRLILGAALASLMALLFWTPVTQLAGLNSTSPPGPGAIDTSREAIIGRGVPDTGNGVPAAHAPATSSWGAVAISRSDNVIGLAPDAPTRERASALAMVSCIAHHGIDCRPVLAGQGQCFAVATLAGSAPVAAQADSLADAQRRALATCNAGPKEIRTCAVSTSFCSGN